MLPLACESSSRGSLLALRSDNYTPRLPRLSMIRLSAAEDGVSVGSLSLFRSAIWHRSGSASGLCRLADVGSKRHDVTRSINEWDTFHDVR